MRKNLIKRVLAVITASMMIGIATVDSRNEICSNTQLKAWAYNPEYYNQDYPNCPYDKETKTLTIRKGFGDQYGMMHDFDTIEAPWAIFQSEIEKVIIEDGIFSIGSKAFYNCKALKSLTIPDTVHEIHSSAFESCSSLSQINLSGKIMAINTNAFSKCTSLTEVNIEKMPSTAMMLGDRIIRQSAFSDCTILSKVTLPDDIEHIEKDVFKGCSSSLTIVGYSNSSAEKYAKNNGFNFKDINSEPVVTEPVVTEPTVTEPVVTEPVVTEPTVTEPVVTAPIVTQSPEVYSQYNQDYPNCPYDKDTKTLTIKKEYCNEDGRMPRPSMGAKGPPWFIFRDEMENVVIEDGVTTIMTESFRDCSVLTYVSIPKSMKTIDGHSFWDCPAITQITISGTELNIFSSAFHRCSSMTTAILPDTLVYIAPDAFSDCPSFSTIKGSKNTIAESYAKERGYAFVEITNKEPNQPFDELNRDINEDGAVTTGDLISLAKMIIGTENKTPASDLNSDGEVNSLDFLELRKVFLA